MTRGTRLVIVGSGGHASDVLGVVEALNEHNDAWAVEGLVDDRSADTARLAGRGVDFIGRIERLQELDAAWVVAIGFPSPRRRVAEHITTITSAEAAVLVHPFADVGHGVRFGTGSVVLGQARLSANAHLGPHSMVSYLASVGHDSVIGAYTSVMPGAMVAGDTRVGDEVLIGAGAVVLEGRSVGNGAVIGAGAVVTRDVPAGAKAVGVPAQAVH